MKAAVISHTYVTPMNQAKIQALARYFSQVNLITPQKVPDTLRDISYITMPQAQFGSHPLRTYLEFHNSLRIYSPGELNRVLNDFGSDVWFVEQEPYSLSTWQVLRKIRRKKKKIFLYSFQNIFKKYPWPFSWVEKKCLQWADGLIVGSRSAQEVWIQKGFPADKIEILPQVGVDLDFFTVAEASGARQKLGLEEKFTFGFAGRLVEEKGVQVLISAAGQLKSADFQVLIVGKGPYEAELRKQIQREGLEKKFIFVGAPKHEEMPLYLQAMEVLILPSLVRSHWREQFGHVLIEAMACERCCIGSDLDPINQIIEGSGLVFQENNAEDLAQKMRQLLSEKNHLSDRGKRAREKVQNQFTNDYIAKKLFELSQNEKREI